MTRKYYNPRIPQKKGCFILSAGDGYRVNIYDCTRLNEAGDGIHLVQGNIDPKQAGYYWKGYVRDMQKAGVK